MVLDFGFLVDLAKPRNIHVGDSDNILNAQGLEPFGIFSGSKVADVEAALLPLPGLQNQVDFFVCNHARVSPSPDMNNYSSQPSISRIYRWNCATLGMLKSAVVLSFVPQPKVAVTLSRNTSTYSMKMNEWPRFSCRSSRCSFGFTS
mgnify:CR=1 FL=1